MVIRGIKNRTLTEVEEEIAAGGRFVFYECCISLIVVSSRQPSDIYFLPPGNWGIIRGLPWCLISLICGWWGVPWGLIYTPLTLFNNLSGGCDVTDEVLAHLQSEPSHGSGARAGMPSCDPS
jgi:hypothetical protein